jgi:hypothetical protein
LKSEKLRSSQLESHNNKLQMGLLSEQRKNASLKEANRSCGRVAAGEEEIPSSNSESHGRGRSCHDGSYESKERSAIKTN